MKKLTKKLNFKSDTVEAYCECHANCSCYQVCGAVRNFKANNLNDSNWDGRTMSAEMRSYE
ncbi:CLI_3235 family bacteriocin precursor [Clostridium botulinum]|uniref:CLI_3235 family bacteriocin precursor n=1 Tax=Clostridium botulinum TaxID=1491 RepID=UPI000D33A020|nr:CLI_3235 family bacteriocin precursor [Clostridium botulinum]AWB31439.1 putative bacteriocin precursor [Clostridium botulinum]MBY6829330.1 CLI_3235 family bacteriocin precursor [Clostridium botulinum]MBY6962449.1 CLI_3235 family bacteriocin precursor [Clostridium botulinum]